MRLSHLLLLAFFSTLMYDSAFSGRVSCPKLSLPNGRVKMRARGNMAYFKCSKNYTRLGDKFAVCLNSGQWSHVLPICIAPGCPPLRKVPNLEVKKDYDGAMLNFTCAFGTTLKGPGSITCNGRVWSDHAPFCEQGVSMSCDFEEFLCGWTQDQTDNFDWTRNSGQTPTMNTGPEGDHTTGSGHYMFIETSSPRKAGDVARLISPIHPATYKNLGMEFWYHMKGPGDDNNVGSLEVYVKPETLLLEELDPEFYMEGYQGDDWIRGFIKIPKQDENFQIIIVGTRLDGFVSDIAIDDIKIESFSKPEATTSSSTTTAMSTTPALATLPTTKQVTTPTTSATTKQTSRLEPETTIMATKETETTTMATKKLHPPTLATTETERTTMATRETETTAKATKETETTTLASKKPRPPTLANNETETTTWATRKPHPPTLSTKETETTTLATTKPQPPTLATKETEATTIENKDTEATTMETKETETTTIRSKETEATTVANKETKITTATTLPETTNKSRWTGPPVFTKKMRIKLATQEGNNYFLDMILYNLNATVVRENDTR